MGMDIAFDRAKAVAAGLRLVKETRGGPDEIRKAHLDQADQDYIDYLSEVCEFVRVPGTKFMAENGSATDDSIVMRANKWGSLYGPMTRWLTDNGITWSEF